MVFLENNDTKIDVHDICLFFVCLIAFPVSLIISVDLLLPANLNIFFSVSV
jgi:hypothetical protein